MKRIVYFFGLFVVFFLACARGEEQRYPYRWVYASRSLRNDHHVDDLREIAQTASEHGINGILLSAGFDRLDLQPPEYFQRLKKVREICRQYDVEIIPSVYSVGYGSSVLAHNKNLAAGIPVKDALFVVAGDEARLIADPPVQIANGGFEDYDRNQVAGYSYSGKPGEVISVDRKVSKEGKSSLRFENFDRYPASSGRLSQEVTVQPYRCYRLSCWLKTEGLDPSKPFSSGNIRLRALGADGRPLEYMNINAPSTGDWFEVNLGFNSLGYRKVEIILSAAEGKSGRFWMDDLRLEEVGLINVLRRPGTPLTVRSEKNGTLYEEGRDYAPVADPELNFHFDHDGPAIRILPESRIQQGERLRVSYYHGINVYDGQVTVCMSEPEMYDIWRTQARLINQHLTPEKYFLALDEIRAGGTCQACKERSMTMGQILGDCITRAVSIIREVNPEAQIFIWSDMLDPNHNAGIRQGNYYYHVNETYTGSWNYVPKDLVIACWWYKKRLESLAYFSGLGFRTIGAAYYDADDLENPKGWLEALDATPGACGIMYTTWLNKYALLADFGDLVSEHWR